MSRHPYKAQFIERYGTEEFLHEQTSSLIVKRCDTGRLGPSLEAEHYSSQNDKFPDLECIDAIKASMSPEAFQGYLKGNIIKYSWRYADKDNPKEDLAKAQVYLGWLMQEISNG